jgi:hypothetical protein
MSLRSLCLIGVCALVLGCGDAGSIDTACRSNADCAESELCATGLCENGIGICVERPTTCSDVDDPVCGCDGQVYQNLCFANMAGVRISNEGPCFPTDP